MFSQGRGFLEKLAIIGILVFSVTGTVGIYTIMYQQGLLDNILSGLVVLVRTCFLSIIIIAGVLAILNILVRARQRKLLEAMERKDDQQIGQISLPALVSWGSRSKQVLEVNASGDVLTRRFRDNDTPLTEEDADISSFVSFFNEPYMRIKLNRFDRFFRRRGK